MFSASKSGQISKGLPDPQFNYVTALLHGDGTNGAQNNTFLDSSSNAFTVTRNGTPTQGSFSPYGTLWSNYFNGSTGNYLVTPSSGLPTASGDFTVSCWFNLQSFANAYYCIGGNWTSGTSSQWLIQIANDGSIRFLTTANTSFSSAGVVALNTWNYFSASRSGTTVTVSLNGSTLYTYTKSDTLGNTTDPIYIGSQATGSTWNFNGYISNLRFVTSAQSATIPTAPATAISGTSILTCQSNRFIDNSSNAFAITVNGTPSIQRFNPFLPTYLQAYSTSVYGGSGYLNGSSDYLSLPSNSVFGFGTGNFTLEAWIYLTSFNSYNSIIASRTASNDNASADYSFGIDNTGSIFMYSASFLAQSSASAIKLNTWTHVAVVRSGTGSNQTVIYVNGTSTATGTATNNLTGTTCSVGALGNGNEPFYGYISDARVVKGTAVYTSTFTPPTAPLTAISGTSYIGSMTNGAIYDNAMMNDLITGGSAQISTSVKKYGSGSLSFNGTTDILTSKAVTSVYFQSGNWTVEFWVNFNSLSGTQVFVNFGYESGSTRSFIMYVSSGSYHIAQSPDGTTNYDQTLVTTSLSTGTWYHFAYVRNSGTITFYINGTSSGTATAYSLSTIPTTWSIGSDGTNFLNGYIDDLRITKGYARYTSNFTPPTQALPNYGM